MSKTIIHNGCRPGEVQNLPLGMYAITWMDGLSAIINIYVLESSVCAGRGDYAAPETAPPVYSDNFTGSHKWMDHTTIPISEEKFKMLWQVYSGEVYSPERRTTRKVWR